MPKNSLLHIFITMLLLSVTISCTQQKRDIVHLDPNLVYMDYIPKSTDKVMSRKDYADKLYGFWLGQCIANWTGLVTEMDKIGNIGEIKTGDFYTRDNFLGCS